MCPSTAETHATRSAIIATIGRWKHTKFGKENESLLNINTRNSNHFENMILYE
jgi:hypothetical protein